MRLGPTNLTAPPQFKDRTEALLLANLLIEYESRRTAADNRAYVLAVFSGAQMLLILQQGRGLVQDLPEPLSYVAFVIVSLLATIALLTNVNMVLPIRRKKRDRANDERTDETPNHVWFWHVGQCQPAQYRDEIRALTEAEQQDQLYVQVAGIAKMLHKRYRQAIDAGRWLKRSAAVTILFVVLNQIWMPMQGVIEHATAR